MFFKKNKRLYKKRNAIIVYYVLSCEPLCHTCNRRIVEDMCMCVSLFGGLWREQEEEKKIKFLFSTERKVKN